MLLKTAAKCLGWASFGIGLAELLAPRQVERVLGVRGGRTRTLVRAMGAREVLHGVGVLAPRSPKPGVWARVGGDVVDTALLGAAATRTRNVPGFVTAAAMVLAIGALDLIIAKRLSDRD